MKIVSGKVTSTTPISLSKAAKSLSKFAVSNHEASHAVSLYLQRAADSFNHLVKIHEKLKPNVKVEEVSVKNVDIPYGSPEIKNLGKEENPENQKLIKAGETVKSKKSEMGFIEIEHPEEILVKNVDIPNGSPEIKKRKNLGKEENPETNTSKMKKSSKFDKVKDRKLIKAEKQVDDIGEGETVKSKKNELEFVKIDTVQELKEVKEEGMTSRDKKKRKKKNRGVGDSEQEVGKGEEDLGNKAEEEGEKRKSVVPDAGSKEQSSKKKSKKKKRIEDEK